MEKTILKGKLEFIDLWNPIKLFTDNGEIDLREHYFSMFERLDKSTGRKATMDYKPNSIEFISDEKSEGLIDYRNDEDGIGISIQTGTSTSYINAYLPMTLQALNGRQVTLEISENGIKTYADSEEDVLGLYYTGKGNCCKIPEDKVKPVCKPGTHDCCIFLAAGSEGFECLKFDSYNARQLLNRHNKGQMNASRIGNCKVIGRKD